MVYMYMQCMQWYTCGLVFLTCVGISTLTSGFSFSMDVVMESSMKFSVDVVILSSAALSVGSRRQTFNSIFYFSSPFYT